MENFNKLPPPIEMPEVESLVEFKNLIHKYDFTENQLHLIISRYLVNQSIDFARATKVLNPEDLPGLIGDSLSAAMFGIIRVLQERETNQDLVNKIVSEKLYNIFADITSDLGKSTGVKITLVKESLH